jgi:hypothetical protein
LMPDERFISYFPSKEHTVTALKEISRVNIFNLNYNSNLYYDKRNIEIHILIWSFTKRVGAVVRTYASNSGDLRFDSCPRRPNVAAEWFAFCFVLCRSRV